MESRCNGLAAMQLMSTKTREEVSFMVNEGIVFLCFDKPTLRKAQKMREGS
jgi:hypothetical protein